MNTNSSHKAPNDGVVIEIHNLKKSFGAQSVIKDVSFQLMAGENLAVVGKSGTGKSVLAKCIVRLLNFESGTIKVLGEDVHAINNDGLGELRKKVGFLFQSGALYDSMTVKENLEFPLRRIQKNLSQKEINEKIKEVLENVGLPDVLDKMPSQLSGGMRKRISVARTIVVNPKLILYDEPTTGLDPVTSAEMSALINDIRNKYNTSSLIITHDMACVHATADRVIMLNDGEVCLEGSLDVFEKSNDALVTSFFKSPGKRSQT